MRSKKVIIAVLVMFVLSTGVVFAAAVNGEFNGFPIVNVKVNEKAVKADVPGIVMQGRTLLPVRAVAENVGALVSWDQSTMTASIIKPEAEMLFVDDIEVLDDGSWNLINPYTKREKGNKELIIIYYEISNINKGNLNLKVVGYDANGKSLGENTTVLTTEDEAGGVGYFTFEGMEIGAAGEYTFELQLMHEGKYQTIATKTLYVK